MEQIILKALAEPQKAGEVAATTGLNKDAVNEVIKKLVKEGKVSSPKRCYYQAVK